MDINVHVGNFNRGRAHAYGLMAFPIFLTIPPRFPTTRLVRILLGSLVLQGSRLVLGNLQGSLRQNLIQCKDTLHFGSIKTLQSLISFFCLLVLIDPLGPIHLDILILIFILEQSWPKWFILMFLFDRKNQMEASFRPFRGLLIDFIIEIKSKRVFLLITDSNKCEGGLCKFYFLVIDVSELYFKINFILPLSPFCNRMPRQNQRYSMMMLKQNYKIIKISNQKFDQNPPLQKNNHSPPPFSNFFIIKQFPTYIHHIVLHLSRCIIQIQLIFCRHMDDPSENIDNDQIEEIEQPIQNQENVNLDSEDEDQFPQFGNDENKKLFELIRQKKRHIKKVNKEFNKDYERRKILEEHLKNVDQELLNTKSLIDSKNKETETQNHLWQVTERQSGRLQNEIKKFNKVIVDHQERLNDIQVRIFRVNEKVEQIKLELNWNQEELQQWAITGKQKQEDHVTLQKYRKEDDTKIRQLNLQIEKLTIEVGRKQQELQKEITSTQASQIQLDKTAQEFKKEHDQRHKLFQKWQDVTTTIARRDEDILKIGEEVGQVLDVINNNKEILDEKKRQLDDQKKFNKEQQAKNVLGFRDISEKKNQNKQLQLSTISNLRAEVQILKNQLSSFSTEWANKRNLVSIKNQELLQKKQRLQSEQAKFKAYEIKLKNQLKLNEKFENAKAIAESTYKDRQAQRKQIEQQIALQKQISVRNTQQLFKLRQEQASLYGQIQGIMAACRNLQSHINKLNQQFQKQQELLYNAEYQIQLMERKVARAKGERTLEQKKDLQKDIEQATKKNKDVKEQYKILNQSVKKLKDDERAVENKLNDVKAAQKKLNSQIEQLSLENDMTIQDLSKVTKKKEEVLVQHDIMKLQIKKIKQNLNKATDHVYGLQNKKNQLQMSMQERQKQILVHRDVLLAEQKAIQDQRHRIAIELAQRRNKVKNLRIKYESLVQKAHGSQDGEAEHSQAYYVIKASQEREELQRKGDELSGKINQAQKKLKGLQNTLLSLTNTNINLAAKIGQKGVSKSELAQKQALEEQCNAASQNLFKKKNELKKLQQQYEQDAKRLTETLNRKQTLEERKSKLEQVIFKQAQDLNQLEQKKLRAEKSLNLMQANWNKKKIEITDNNPHLAQLEYDIEIDKNKTLISSLKNLGEDLPDLGPLIDDFLKENNIDLPSKAPSSVDMLSSKGSVSIKSGGSAISRSSKMSKK